MRRLTASIGLVVALQLVGCGAIDKKENKNVANNSEHGKAESHNMGLNCMSCHRSGGDGKGYFMVAGTTFKSDQKTTAPNGTIELFTEPQGAGTKVATIGVDALGNFYTTNTYDFGAGVYAAYTPADGETRYMTDKTTTGACNSCHGVSTDKIFAP